ncbi:MAG: flavodoxin family protein [Hydrogeniiclostridium mannosilyticum]
MIFVGSPCWWGRSNPLRTFLHQNDLAGKRVVPFMTHGTSGLHVQDVKSSARMRDFESISGFHKVNTPANMGDYKAEIDRWLKELSL